MSMFKLFTAVWVSIIIYSFLSAFFGASGFSALERVSAERERLAENLDDLQMINAELDGSLNALQYDSDTIAVYARELGYGAPNERFIRIAGISPVTPKRLSAGRQILPLSPDFVPDKTIHIISILSGVFVLLFLIVVDMRKKRTRINA